MTEAKKRPRKKNRPDGQPPRKPGPVLNHNQREKAIRLVGRLLMEGASQSVIQEHIQKAATEDAGRPIEITTRTIESWVRVCRARARNDFGRSPEELAAEQYNICREVQVQGLRRNTPASLQTVVRSSHRIAKLLGLDQPAEMKLLLQEGQRVKDEVMAAFRTACGDDPALLRRFADALARKERGSSKGATPTTDDEDLGDDGL